MERRRIQAVTSPKIARHKVERLQEIFAEPDMPVLREWLDDLTEGERVCVDQVLNEILAERESAHV